MGEPVATEQQQVLPTPPVAPEKDENGLNEGQNNTTNTSIPPGGAAAGAAGHTAATPSDIKTVLMNQTDYNYKHPLQHRWCLWFDQIEQGKEWGINLTPIASFETVEDFWGLYNNIIKASELRNDCYFHLFKDGIKPKWEDEWNKKGGRFRFNVPKAGMGMHQTLPQDARQESIQDSEMNRLWLTTILVLIGEQLPGGEDVAGAHIFKKTGVPRIELWVKSSQVSDRTKLEALGKRYKELLQVKETLQFKPHDEQGKRSQRLFSL